MSSSKTMLGGLLILLLALAGCSDDDNPVDQNGITASTSRNAANTYWITTLDATSYDNFVYYNFNTKDVLARSGILARATSTDWHLGFQREVVVTNGGSSGSGGVTSVNLTALGNTKSFDDVTAADLVDLSEGDWQTDGEDLVFDNYYSYNPQTHQLAATDIVYAVRDAEGRFMKLQIADIINQRQPPAMGDYVLRYVHQATENGTDLSGAIQVDTVDGTSGIFYYDFSAGAVVSPSNPATSLEWDIKVEAYDLYLNSSFSGSGVAAANPAYLLIDMADSTDLDLYTEAEITPQAYAQDVQSSVFTNWYTYDGQTHTLASDGDVYVVKVGDKSYKVRIDTYYGTTGVSGNFIWHWEEL